MLGVLAVTGLACASCSGGEDTVEITTTDSAGQTTVITQEVTEDPDDDAGQDRVDPTFAPMEPVTVPVPGGSALTFQMPADWELQELGAASLIEPQPGSIAPHQWCLVPPADLPLVDGCAGLLIASGPDWLPGGVGQPYVPRQVDGWLSTPGRLLCPVDEEGDLRTDEALVTATPDGVGQTGGPDDGLTLPDLGGEQGDGDSEDGADEDEADDAGEGAAGDQDGDRDGDDGGDQNGDDGDQEGDDGGEQEEEEPEPDLAASDADGRPLTSVRTEVDGRAVHYETWRVNCTLSEFTFTPQLWHDPELDVLVKDFFGRPETALVVESLGGG